MKTFLLCLIVFLNIHNYYAQVGIGTTNPQTDLHIAGSLLVQEEMKVKSLTAVASGDEDFQLLTRSSQSLVPGQIKVLDISKLQVAPVNTINYHFKDISLDNLSDVDLQYDTSKYIVGISNFRYVGDAIEKQNISGGKSIGQFVARAYESGGTWHLEIKNRSLDLAANKTVEYYVTVIVYDKSYYRSLPIIITDLNGNTQGTASSIPDFN